MTIDWTKPVETIDGLPVRVLCADRRCHYPVIALVDQPNNSDSLTTLMIDGCAFLGGGIVVRNVPPRPVVDEWFISFFPKPFDASPLAPGFGSMFRDLASANRAGEDGRYEASEDRVLIKVVITDGVVTGAELVKN
jgi:hypothetical protein